MLADPEESARAIAWSTNGVMLVAGADYRLGVIQLDCFDTCIAGNVAAWVPDDTDGAARLRQWADQRLAAKPPPLWFGE